MVETPVDGHDVLVEGRVEGIDLDRLLAERGRPGLPVASVLEWITQSAAALTGLHQNGEVHGDVRPANLVVEPSGSIKLIPPGSSKLPHGNGRSADTAGFRAPEVSAGATPDHRTDVYGLAATTFALLTGATPSTGSANGAAQQVGLLDSALQAGLAADPERRPATPGELAERLRAAWDADTPTGPRTILVSDAIDDASGTNRHPGMQLAVDRAVEDHGGRRIGLTVGGSAAVSVFADAVSAVRAAIALQRGLGQSLESVPVQVGLASCDVADASALDALATQAGRVKDLAGPGEILLSASTAELVRERLRNEMRLVALGPNSVDDADGALAVATVGINAPPDSSRNPYPGLAAFGGSDSDLFFGREQIIEQCLDLLGSERFVAVVGVPGSGKSSLLHAGLVPRLPDAVLLRPGEHPQQSLVDAGAAARPDAVLVVDQLEDIVTRCQAPEERAAFVEAIVDHPGGLAVALRADRYGEFAQFAEFSQLLSSCHVLLGPLVADEVARAVTEPARRCAVDLEDGLTELIAAERPGEPGDLPQLGHALRETWLRREGSTMTLAGYRATGGVQSAVAETAERTYTALDEPDRLVARKLLLRMADLRADGLIPRPVSADEVADVDHARAPAVLSAFASAGLVVVDGDGAVEAPEALSRAWPRLAEWIAKQRATYVVQPKPPRVRSRATQLAVIAVSTSLIAVTAIAMGVVAVTERDAANEQRDVAQSRSLVADARAAATDQPDAAMLLAVEAHADAPSATTTSALVEALLARPSARALLQGLPSAAQTITVDGEHVVAAAGSEVRIWTTDGWQQAGGYQLGDAEISDLALSDDGQSLVAAIPDDHVLIAVDTLTGAPSADPVDFGAMSPVNVVAAGDRVLVVVDDRVNPSIESRVEQRDLRTLDLAGPPLVPPSNRLEDVVVSDDGGRAAMTTFDGTVWLADLDTGEIALGAAAPSGETDVGIDDLAWHDDLLVAGRVDGSVDAWRTDPGGALTAIESFRTGDPVDAVAVGCEGSCLAAGTADGRVLAWRIGADQVPLDVPRAHNGRVRDLEFTTDGAFVVSAGSDDLTLVHALDGSLTIASTAAGGAPARGAYGVGGTILSGTDDAERGRITQLSPTGQITWRTPVDGAVSWLAATGRRVVALVRAADEPMRFMVLDADTGSVLLDQSFDAARVTGAVSPDGSKVVLAAREIWGSSFVAVDLSDLSMSDPITVKERVTAISISPDGSRVVTGHATGDVALRNPESFTADVQSPQQLDDSISAVGFTPDSKAVLAGRQSGVVDVFDATTLEPRFGPLEGHRRVVTGVAANDRIVVTASADGSVRMWDVASGTALGGPIPTGGVTGPSIAIRDDGQRALVQSDRGLLELILAEDEWVRLACSISGRELTEDERASHGLAMSANACGGLG